jgi:hypothetical protein
VAAGLLVLTRVVVDFGEVPVSACLLVALAAGDRQPERCRQLDAGGSKLAGAVHGFAQVAARG